VIRVKEWEKVMLSSVIYGVSQIYIEQIATEGFSTRLAYGLGFLAVVAILTSIWFYMQWQVVQKKVVQNQRDLTQAQSGQSEFRSKSKGLEKTLEERSKETLELKSKLAKHKRKLHDLQEQQKSSEKKLRDDYTKLELSLQEKAAFSVQKPSAPLKKAAPVIKPKEVTPPDPEKVQVISHLEEDNLKLKRQISQLKDDLDKECKAIKTYKYDMRQAARRLEGFRRIDILTKNSLELADDKLAQLGRDYYDTISELAALKGEVVPPSLVKPQIPEPSALAEMSEELAPEEDKVGAKGLVDFNASMKEVLQEEEIQAEHAATSASEELPPPTEPELKTEPRAELSE
jgi:DNA repair exonuclease SbcCD ATPase subunit